jgi:hypothetical protein
LLKINGTTWEELRQQTTTHNDKETRGPTLAGKWEENATVPLCPFPLYVKSVMKKESPVTARFNPAIIPLPVDVSMVMPSVMYNIEPVSARIVSPFSMDTSTTGSI